jgi:alanyl-tRNA synthetase
VGTGFVGTVLDTVNALPGLHRHVVRVTAGEVAVGDRVEAVIDGDRRSAIRRNHTGTHLLHWALREVLGSHVKQQGSWVGPDRLRFDFSHFEAVNPDQIVAIEDLVNRDVLANDVVNHFETSKDDATSRGAIAFFGEKYGDVVRVLEAGPHSIELCGGTHVTRTGDIGPVKIVSETSIGSNLRRIEAVTGTGPIERIRREEAELSAAAERIGVPRPELLEGIDKRLAELRDLRAEVKALRAKLASGGAADLAGGAIDGVVVARVDGLARDDLRTLAVAVRDQPGMRGVVLIGAPEGGGVALVAATADADLDAAALIADAARTVGGGGGKGRDVAAAGGRDASRIDEALDQARAAAGLS